MAEAAGTFRTGSFHSKFSTPKKSVLGLGHPAPVMSVRSVAKYVKQNPESANVFCFIKLQYHCNAELDRFETL